MTQGYVTILHRSGISMRPQRDGDKAGQQAKKQGGGVLEFHATRELASATMDTFWAGRGYDKRRFAGR